MAWSAYRRVKEVLWLLPSLDKLGKVGVLSKSRLTRLGEVACADDPFKIKLGVQVYHVETLLILQVENCAWIFRREEQYLKIERNQVGLGSGDLLQPTTSSAKAGPCAVRTYPIGVILDLLETYVVEVLQTKSAILLLTYNVKLLFVGLPALFVFD